MCFDNKNFPKLIWGRILSQDRLLPTFGFQYSNQVIDISLLQNGSNILNGEVNNKSVLIRKIFFS